MGGIAPHWRITECPTFDAKGNQIAATRDFERWDGTLFDDHVKTKSRIPKGHTPYPKGTHTAGQKPAQNPPMCIPKGHIDLAASMYPKGAHNCLPLPLLSKPTPITDVIGPALGFPRPSLAHPLTAVALCLLSSRCWRLGMKNSRAKKSAARESAEP